MVYRFVYTSPVGDITLIGEGGYLIGAYYGEVDYKKILQGSDVADWNEEDGAVGICQAIKWLDRYFKGEAPDCREIEIKLEGSEFQQEIWKYLLDITYGETVSYGSIAKRAAEKRGISKMSARAVGHAIGKNPVSIIVPCHRVIGSNGKLIGYGGGPDIKRKLLMHEKEVFKDD